MLTRFVTDTDVDVVLVAGRYTLLDQSARGRELLPAARERGVSVIAGGVFNSGLLAAPGAGATYDYQAAPAELIARARRLEEACARFGVPLRAAAARFPLTHPAVASVLDRRAQRGRDQRRARAARTDIPAALWDAARHGGRHRHEDRTAHPGPRRPDRGVRAGARGGARRAHRRDPRGGVTGWTIWRSGTDLFHVIDCADYPAPARGAARQPGERRLAGAHGGAARHAARLLGGRRRRRAAGGLAAMTVIDAHHHVWDLAVRDQPWISGLGPWPRSGARSPSTTCAPRAGRPGSARPCSCRP